MAVTFLFGRAGAGKTRWCLDCVLERLAAAGPDGPLLLLVPEQATFELERGLAARSPRGGYCRAEVLGFSRLAQRLLAEMPGGPQRLGGSSRRLALRMLVRDVPLAAAFGSVAREAGFFRELDRMLGELLREDVSPEALDQAAEQIDDATLRRRLGVLAEVARRYAAWLGPERIDPAAQLQTARRQLASAAWAPGCEVWVDGFAGFTGQESATLVALAQRCRSVVITALVPPDFDVRVSPASIDDFADVFAPTKRTVLDLLDRFQRAGVELEPPERLDPPRIPRFERAPSLARLEWGLARPGVASPAAEAPGDEVRIVACDTPRGEFVAAARAIRARLIRGAGTIRYRDFAIIARDLAGVEALAHDVLPRYGIPFFIDSRRPLAGHALERFVRTLFELLIDDFRPATASRLLRSGLLPLDADEAEMLEQAVRRHALRGRRAWRMPRWDFCGEAQPLAAARRSIVDALARLDAGDARPAAARDWVERLYAALEALGVPRRMAEWVRQCERDERWEAAALHRLAWSELVNVLDEAHEVLDEAPLSLSEAATVLGRALGERSRGLAPPALDQVLISAVERSRHPDIRFAWVLGMNDGRFPRRPPQDAFLSAAARARLVEAGLSALASAEQRLPAERLLAYVAMTRPSEGLVLSYARQDDEGTPLFASALLEDVRAALPGIQEAQQDDDPLTIEEAVGGFLRARESDDAAARRRYGQIVSRLRSLPVAAAETRARLAGLRNRNRIPAVPGPAQTTEGDVQIVWSGSPTEIDRYVQCPFQHFVVHRLGLHEPAEPPATRRDLGSAAHHVLAEVARRAIRDGRAISEIGPEQWQRWIDESLAVCAQRRAADPCAQRPEAKLLESVLFTQLRTMITAHIARWRRGASAPLHVEHVFRDGMDDALPSLRIEIEPGQVAQIHGRVDRIDRCTTPDGAALLVYDYKTATERLRTRYLTGPPLQILTYLLAVQHAYRGSADMQIGGVFVAPLYPDGAALRNSYVSAAEGDERAMHLYRPRGLFDESLAPALDAQLGNTASPVAAMKMTQSGRLHATSDARPVESIGQVLELTQRTIASAVRGIVSGQVPAAPLRDGRRLACAACGYRAVCRYDARLNAARDAGSALPQLAGGAAGDDEEAAS